MADMKNTAVRIREYFKPVLGTCPLRVKPGVGSFLTFEFGPRSKVYGHLQARWRLWIYLSNWTLYHGDHRLVDSDSDRKRITIVAHRLEEEATLTDVRFDSRSRRTTFFFREFRLLVTPSDYLEDVDDRDDYWIFFMPDNKALALGPSGIQLEQVKGSHLPADGKKQELRIQEPSPRRELRVDD
jgi:hypothetical protein